MNKQNLCTRMEDGIQSEESKHNRSDFHSSFYLKQLLMFMFRVKTRTSLNTAELAKS